MALTIADNAIAQEAPKFLCYLDATFDDSYATGGLALDYEDYIPAGAVLHGVVCLEEGVIVDVFTPAREDFLEG